MLAELLYAFQSNLTPRVEVEFQSMLILRGVLGLAGAVPDTRDTVDELPPTPRTLIALYLNS